MRLTEYHAFVNMNLEVLTDGAITDSDMLVDFADGEASVAECWENDVPARECAENILAANGWDEASAFVSE